MKRRTGKTAGDEEERGEADEGEEEGELKSKRSEEKGGGGSENE